MSRDKPPLDPRKRHRRIVVGAGVVGLVAVVVLCLPWILAATPLRHRLVQAVVNHPQLQASVDRADFGWWHPLQLDDLVIERPDGYLRLELKQLRAERSWLQLLLQAPDLGTVTLEHPTVDFSLGATWEPIQRKRRATLLTAIVNSAHLRLRLEPDATPVVDVPDLSVTLQITATERGRILTLEPLAVLDHQPLTPELCDRGLQLIAPVLARSADVAGEVSFRTESFRLPLDEADPQRRAAATEIRGLLELHHVSSGLENPLLLSITHVLGTILGRDVPKTLEVAENTSVAFAIKEGRVHHEGMAFMLPDLSQDMVVHTSGSVGLDESLDLLVEVQLPLTLLADSPLARRLSARPVGVRVTGTLDRPRLGLPANAGWLNQIGDLLLRGRTSSDEMDGATSGTAASDDPALTRSILDAVGDLLNSPRKDTSPDDAEQGDSILDRVRKWRRSRTPSRRAPDPPEHNNS